MLKQRIITALILAPSFLWALFGLKDQHLMLLFAFIMLVGSFEWIRLAEIEKGISRFLFIIVQAILLGLAWYVIKNKQDLVLFLLSSAVLAWILIMFWLAMHEKGVVKIHLNQSFRIMLGMILLPLCLLGVGFLIQNFENDRLVVLLMFLLIWGADIAAYFSGKAFGKHKLAPSISPGKSWEGVFGALLATVVISIAAAWLMNYPNSIVPGFVLFCLVVVVLSVVGDLFESLLKRQVGIKDSSNLLPGHGGVLDRIDSMIAASPIFALGMYLLGVS